MKKKQGGEMKHFGREKCGHASMRKYSSVRRHERERRGAAAVEFALVAPIFFLLVMGMIEVGRAVMVQQILTNAAREGARQATLDGMTADDVTGAVNTYLSNSTMPAATVTFPQGYPENVSFGDPVAVEVSLSFSQVSWLASPMYLGGKNLSAQSVMRRESAF
jgi:Flp pilus assembly pilin Flp